MKLVEILKNQGLSDEQINKIIADMEGNKVYTTSIENVDEKYSKLETEKNNLKGQLETANTTIKDLKKDNKDNETLQNTIAEHEKTIENLKKDKINTIKENAIDAKFANVPDKYKELLKSRIDREKINVNEDGTTSGLDEQYNPIADTYSELFEDEGPNNTGGLGNFKREIKKDTKSESIGEKLAKQSIEINNKNHGYFGGAE